MQLFARVSIAYRRHRQWIDYENCKMIRLILKDVCDAVTYYCVERYIVYRKILSNVYLSVKLSRWSNIMSHNTL